MEEITQRSVRSLRAPTIICIAALLALPFAGKLSLWLPLTGEKVDLGRDLVGLMLPWVQGSIDAWREGGLPTWTALEGLGRPLHVNLQSQAFYPGTLLLALVSGGRLGLTLLEFYVLLHLAVAGLGTYFLARTLGLGRGAACIAGIIYPSSGFFLHHVTILSMTASAAWVPWVLAAALRSMRPGGWRWVAGTAVFIALSVLGGLPQPAYYAVLSVVLMSLYFAVRHRSLVPLLKLAATGILSFSIAAPALLPGLRELPELIRGRNWRSVVQNPELLPARLLSLLAPQAGSQAHLAIPFVLFFGTAALILAVIGTREKRLSHRGLLFAGLALFLVIASVEEIALDGVLAGGLPGYSYFKEHNRAGVMFCLLGAVLAGAGLQRLRAGSDKLDRHLAAGAGVVVVAAQLTAVAWMPRWWGNWRLSTFALAATAAALLCVAAIALLRRAPRAAVAAAFVICAGQLLLFTNTNNLRIGVREKLREFAAQANVLPRETAPPRVMRRRHRLWPTLDAYNRINAFRSEDTNQYAAFRRLWQATGKRPELALMWGVRYLIAESDLSQRPRSLEDFQLGRFNRLQRLPLLQAGPAKWVRIRLAVRSGGDGLATASAALRTADGKILDIPLREDSRGAGNRHRFRGYLSFDKAVIEAVWVSLEKGKRAGIASVETSAGPVQIEPAFVDLGRHVYRITDALPRALLVPVVQPCAGAKEMLHRMKMRVDLEENVLLLASDAPAEASDPWSAAEAARAAVEITDYSRHRIRIALDAPREAYLVLSDFYHGGWSAEVDGKPAKILRANYCARAVRVPPGKHTVEFVYTDNLTVVGLVVSLLALVLSAGVIAWPRRKV